jgi:K+-transporting ATPase ATPase C chain
MKNIKICIKIFTVLFILTGVIYPLLVTLTGQIFFHEKANGSIVYLDNKKVGSRLIGQYFESSRLFWSRPSPTRGFPYNALYSGGSNLSPTNPLLIKQVEERIQLLKKKGMDNYIPSCLVLGSGSGLDPDITPEAAYIQIPGLSKSTGISQGELKALVKSHTDKKIFGFLGADRVNVLGLNISLMKLEEKYAAR